MVGQSPPYRDRGTSLSASAAGARGNLCPVTTTPEHDARIATMKFAAVYPHYVAKVERKGRTVAELHEVIRWLTGYGEADLPGCHYTKCSG